MKSVLLIGLGRFGRQVAKTLNELGHEVMAIDRNEECVDGVLSYVTSAQIGDTTDRSFVRSLGVKDFDLCIVAIGDDFQGSLETTFFLKECGAPFVVSRASRGCHAELLLRNGADDIVYPEEQLGKWTAIRYSSDHIFDYVALDDNYAIYEVDVPESWEEKTIKQLDIRHKYNINIIAYKRDRKLGVSVGPETIFQKNDTLLVIGSNKDVSRCFRLR